MRAQSHVNPPDPALGTPSVDSTESHIGGLTGHAAAGQEALSSALVLGATGRMETVKA